MKYRNTRTSFAEIYRCFIETGLPTKQKTPCTNSCTKFCGSYCLLETSRSKSKEKKSKSIPISICKMGAITFFYAFWKCNKMHKLCFPCICFFSVDVMFFTAPQWKLLTLCAIKWLWQVPQHHSALRDGTIPISFSTQQPLALMFWEGSCSENKFRSIYRGVNMQSGSSI